VSSLLARLRFASAPQLGIGAALALVATVVLETTTPRGTGDLFVAVLFGFSLGLGAMAIAVYLRNRTRA